MSSPQQFTIEPADADTRLDKFLTSKLPNTTRSQIQKLIKAGHVTVNGKSAAVHRFLKTSDIVAMNNPSPLSSPSPVPAAKTPSPSREREERKKFQSPLPEGEGTEGEGSAPGAIEVENRTPTVIYEDAEMLVVEKPAGLLVHATTQKESHTITSWLHT